jgi:uncharacterized membrane protein required for colicin V production
VSYNNLFDLLVLLLLVCAFIVGYLQGTVRRVLGIIAILFCVVLAGQIRGPFGDFLIGNWTQFPADYSRMLGFALVFVFATLAFTILIETYKDRSHIMPRHRYVDPIVGGLLGVFQAGVVIGAGILILDSYFRGTGIDIHPTEILFVRDFDHAVDVSETAQIYRHDLIPTFFALIGGVFPQDIRQLFPR